MRATTTPEAAAACSLVTSVSPIVNAVPVPHLSPYDTTFPSKSFLVSGSSESSTIASYSRSDASSSTGTIVSVLSSLAEANLAILLTSDHVESSAGVGFVVK